MRFPPPLHPGDTVVVVAPSGAFDHVSARAGMAWLGARYRVRHGKTLLAHTPDGYLAGSDRRRQLELQRAFDSDAAALVAVRGGYGLSRIAALLDWTGMLRRPKWLVGFSDFTVVHAEAWRRRLASAHASMVCGLSQASAEARTNWIDALERPSEQRAWSGLSCLRPGHATGTLVGGNLAMLHAAAAAGRLSIPRGAVLLIEDVGERPYRVDRMLTNLMEARHLEHLAAVVVGDFTACEAGSDGRTVEAVLADRLRVLRVPVVAGMPVGHGTRNDAIILGQQVAVHASRRATTFQARP